MARSADCTRPSVPRRVRRPSDAIALVRAVLGDLPDPVGELVLGLDAHRSLAGIGVRPDVGEHPVIDAHQLVLLAAELEADALVLVSLLADERELEVEADVQGFVELGRACLADGVLLLDHVLVAGATWHSLWNEVVLQAWIDEPGGPSRPAA